MRDFPSNHPKYINQPLTLCLQVGFYFQNNPKNQYPFYKTDLVLKRENSVTINMVATMPHKIK